MPSVSVPVVASNVSQECSALPLVCRQLLQLFNYGRFSTHTRPLARQNQRVPRANAGPALGNTTKGQATFTKPSSYETLFSAVPNGKIAGRVQPCPVVTVLSIVRDAGSWGDDGRQFVDFLQVRIHQNLRSGRRRKCAVSFAAASHRRRTAGQNQTSWLLRAHSASFH